MVTMHYLVNTKKICQNFILFQVLLEKARSLYQIKLIFQFV